MPTKSINHLAVWVSAIVFFFWGYVWYNILFKNQVTSMMAQMNAQVNPSSPVPYIVGFLMALVLGYGTAIALADSQNHTASHGISFALFMGVIFYAGPRLTQTLFGGQPIAAWLIDIGWALIGFALVGAIVGGWKARAAA